MQAEVFLDSAYAIALAVSSTCKRRNFFAVRGMSCRPRSWYNLGGLATCIRANTGSDMSNDIYSHWPSSAEPSSISSTLLVRIKEQRPKAWSRLADLYGPVVYRWCRQRGVARDDAPDLVQEVFAAVVRHVDGFRRDRPGDSFAAWLRTITQNVVRDHFRACRHRPSALGGTDAQQRFCELPDPARPQEANDSATVSDVVVPLGLELIRSEFETRTWDAFRRAVIEKQPPARIAQELGMSVAAVYQAKSRVLRRLRRDLDGLLE